MYSPSSSLDFLSADANDKASSELLLATCSHSDICLLYNSAMCSGTNSVPHPRCLKSMHKLFRYQGKCDVDMEKWESWTVEQNKVFFIFYFEHRYRKIKRGELTEAVRPPRTMTTIFLPSIDRERKRERTDGRRLIERGWLRNRKKKENIKIDIFLNVLCKYYHRNRNVGRLRSNMKWSKLKILLQIPVSRIRSNCIGAKPILSLFVGYTMSSSFWLLRRRYAEMRTTTITRQPTDLISYDKYRHRMQIKGGKIRSFDAQTYLEFKRNKKCLAMKQIY